MRFCSVLLLVCLFCVPSYGQRLSTGGSASQQMESLEAKANWDASKKLSNEAIAGVTISRAVHGDDFETLSVGQFGNLQRWQFKVETVVDANNVLLRVGKHTIWLEGFATDGLVDDQPVRVVDPVQFVKTKTYKTVSGSSRTVRMFKMPTLEEIRKEADAQAELAKQAEEAKFRTWKSKAGTTVEAKFTGWKSNKVELETRVGKKILVDLSAFVDDDAEVLRKLVREFRKTNK